MTICALDETPNLRYHTSPTTSTSQKVLDTPTGSLTPNLRQQASRLARIVPCDVGRWRALRRQIAPSPAREEVGRGGVCLHGWRDGWTRHTTDRKEMPVDAYYTLADLLAHWERGELTLEEVVACWPHGGMSKDELLRELLRTIVGLHRRVMALEGRG